MTDATAQVGTVHPLPSPAVALRSTREDLLILHTWWLWSALDLWRRKR